MNTVARVLLLSVFGFSGLVQAAKMTKAERHVLQFLDMADMTAVQAQAKEILEQCRQPDCLIVSLGPTNTLVDAFLRNELGGSAEAAIQYVPFRALREGIRLPFMQALTLPRASSKAKRVLYVRTLDSSVSIQIFAKKIQEVAAQTGLELEFAGYFSAGARFEDVNKALNGEPGYYNTGSTFPWPFMLREVSGKIVKGSYRALDEYYYRYQIMSAENLSHKLWWADRPIQAIKDLREKVARTVGASHSPGDRFQFTDKMREDWESVTKAHGASGLMPILVMGSYLGTGWGDGKTPFEVELIAIQNSHYSSSKFRFRENPLHADLDKAVKLFKEKPGKFLRLKCEASVAK